MPNPVEELDLRVTYGRDGFSAVRTLLCAWDDHAYYVQQLAGSTYPYYFDEKSKSAKAESIDVEGFGRIDEAPRGGPVWEKAKLRVTYQVPPVVVFLDSTLGIISEDLEPTTEFISLPAGNFRWGDPVTGDNLHQDETPGLLVRGFDWVLTRYQLTQVPVAVLQLLSTCNSDTLYAPSLGLTFPPETLHFQGPQIRRDRERNGVIDITYRFSYRSNGWNKFWRAKTGEWTDIYVAGGGRYRNFPPVTWLDKL